MDPLHSIILSLNANEKRYFNLFAKTFKDDSKTLRLFKEMDAMNLYDEAALKRKMNISDLVPAKMALRSLLFKAMRNYREGVDIYQELRNDISNIDFLLAKDLKEEAGKEIRKAMKAAEKAEAYQYMAELSVYAGKAERGPLKTKDIEEHFFSLIRANEKAVTLQQEVQRTLLYHAYFVFYMRHANYESPGEVGAKVAYLGAEMERMLGEAKSDYAKLTLLIGMASAHADRPKSLKHYEQIRQIYKREPYNIQKRPQYYLAFLSNYLTLVSHEPDKARLSRQLIAELENAFHDFDIYFKYHPDRHLYFRKTLMGNKLAYIKALKEWDGFDEIKLELKQMLSKKSNRGDSVMALITMGVVSISVDLQQYSEALDWINIYYTLYSSKTHLLAMFCARFYEVVCFYSVKNYHLSAVKAKNLVNTMAEQNLNGEYYNLLTGFLRRLNVWELSNPRHLEEIKTLQKSFEKLKAAEDENYVVLQSYLLPDEVMMLLFGK